MTDAAALGTRRRQRAAAARGPIDILVANAGGAEIGALREDRSRPVSPHDRAQRDGRRALLHSAVLAEHGRARLRPHRRRRVDGRPQGLCLCVGLLRRQACRRRARARAGDRDRDDRRHRQRRVPGLHRYRPGAARASTADRGEDRPVATTTRSPRCSRPIRSSASIKPEEVAAAVLYPVLAGCRRGHRARRCRRGRGGVSGRRSRPIPLDAETKVAERPDDHKTELRLWLRLFTCKMLIEGEVRRRLRDTFDVTLPRFDLMAQLERAPDGMTLRRAVAAHDGVERQRDRAGRSPRRAGCSTRPPLAERPPRPDRQPHAPRAARCFRAHGASQRRLGRPTSSPTSRPARSRI